MIENNLSSYSNRADCVDNGPDLGEWPTDFVDDSGFGFQSPRLRVQDPEQIINAKVLDIANEVKALYERKERGTLTNEDKERIWRDGTEEDRLELGEWRPPAVSSLPPLSARIQRALAGFAALEKERAEKDPLLNPTTSTSYTSYTSYSDDALYD